MIGTRVDSYELQKVLGQGAMGVVYRARHAATGREVALKLLLPGKHLTPEAQKQAFERFKREALAMGSVATSQHAVSVLDAGVDPATAAPFVVMELLQGEDLDALLSRLGPLPVDLALRIVAQTLSGLIPAHEKGIVHRDVKPANLFLMRRDEAEPIVKVLDFGIAKMRGDEKESAMAHLTKTGSTLGSPSYMSPEQVKGSAALDGRSDLWSLGVVLYQLLTGALPFEGDALGAVLLAIMNGAPTPIGQRAPWVPAAVRQILDRAMQRDPAQRFASARAMREAVVAQLGGSSGITEAMLVPLSAESRGSLLPGMAMAVSVPGSLPGSATSPQSAMAHSGTAVMSAVPGGAGAMGATDGASWPGVMGGMGPAGPAAGTVGTQPISALPRSAMVGTAQAGAVGSGAQWSASGTAGSGPAPVPFSFPTQPSSGVLLPAGTSGAGKKLGLILGGLVLAAALGAGGVMLVSRGASPAVSASGAEPSPEVLVDAGAEADASVSASTNVDVKPSDGPNGGTASAPDGGTVDVPEAGAPGTGSAAAKAAATKPAGASAGAKSKDDDPFSNKRTGK